MKHSKPCILAIVLAIISLISCQKSTEVTLTRVDPLLKILPETALTQPYDEVEEVAAGEHATFQYSLRGMAELKDVKISVEVPTDGAGHSLEAVTTGFVDFVHEGRTTLNPAVDVIRSASGMYPDPIDDDGSLRDIPAGMTQPVWVTVDVPKDAIPGVYNGKIRLSGEGFNLESEIALKVYPVVLEEPTLWITNWFNSSEGALKYFDPEATIYSEEYWEYIRAIASKMKVCYQNTVLIPLSTITSTNEGGSWSFNFDNFDKMVGIFIEAGVLKRLEVGHVGGRVGKWNSPFGVNVPGKGNAGQHNGINGNIQVFIEEKKDDVFVRDGQDVIYSLLLDFPTAALGGEVEIPTIEETKVKIKIEPGTQPGKTLRLRGKGLPAVQGYGSGTGDLVVNISVYVPKELSRSEKETLEHLRHSDNFKGDSLTKQSIFDRFKNYFN